MTTDNEIVYRREYWSGDSRDGNMVNGDGYHYYKMTNAGIIIEAYEYYEHDDGVAVVSPLPEMIRIDWLEDLGFENFDVLDEIGEGDFLEIRKLADSK